MKNIRYFFKISTLVLLLSVLGACKDFLNVEPKDSLSGNNFWLTQQDVETFTLDIYRLFRVAIGTAKPLILTADVRCAPVSTVSYPYRRDFDWLSLNQVNTVANTPRPEAGSNAETWWQNYAEYDEMSDWSPMYEVIQACNVMYENVPIVLEKDAKFSPALAARYRAEAVFVRAATYFFLLRLFGDVPYYTNAYNQDPLPRTSHVTVAKNCLAELAAIKDDLPWTYEDPANRGVRGMRGGALALMMHLNMWLAGFDEGNKQAYYSQVVQLGDELINDGEIAQGAYKLASLNDLPRVFQGRSQEGLFEIPQNVNYGDVLESTRKVWFSSVLHAPYFLLHSNPNNSEIAYDPDYMKTIYPEDIPDGRKDLWFDDAMYSGGSSWSCFKFFNFELGEGNTEATMGNNFIIFRLGESILLQAEAAAELGQDEKATALLNRIRLRAEAPAFPAEPGGGELKDAIYWERCKELMGEGHYFYDLVRTKKIYNSEYSYRPISYNAYLPGAWTWPINPKAFTNNPYMTWNTYWN